MRRGKENAFGDGDVDFFFIENEEGRGSRSLPSGFAFQVIIKNSGLARESAGNNIKEGVHVAAAPAHGAAGSASTKKERIHFSQITTSLLGSVWNGRERIKWIYNPSQEWSYVNSRLMENNFHVRFREHFFR